MKRHCLPNSRKSPKAGPNLIASSHLTLDQTSSWGGSYIIHKCLCYFNAGRTVNTLNSKHITYSMWYKYYVSSPRE